MTGNAIVCRLKNITSIEGANKIVKCEMLGETVIISKDHKEGEMGLLFDCETQLSHEYCHYNNLYRHSEKNFDNHIIGYFDDNRRVRPIKLKGVKVSAFWMPLSSLGYVDESFALSEGMELTEVGRSPVCNKYINSDTIKSNNNRKDGKIKRDDVPTFKEHIDTDQFMRNTDLLTNGSMVTITEKLHGTSCRCGYHIINRKKWYHRLFNIEPADRYKFVVGSRRVLKSIEGIEEKNKANFYNSDIWTLASETFKDKLHKGETAYFEITGYLPDNSPIMQSQSNEKLKKFMDKEEYDKFISDYGKTTHFTYGSEKGNFKIFVYRITRTNEDGFSIDLSWDQVKRRCEQMNVNHVPEIAKFMVDDSNKKVIEQFVCTEAELPSKEFKFHLREGVCVRIEDGHFTPKLLKHKGYLFKVLEGLVKDTDVIDIEESN